MAPAETPRRNAPELSSSTRRFIGENRSRPNREETSVHEMDAYDVGQKSKKGEKRKTL
jgi:hypothetical protein